MYSFKRIAISNRHLCPGSLPEQIETLGGRIDILILREKDLSEREYLTLAKAVAKVCKDRNIDLICHTFTAAAREIGCKAIHLPLARFLADRQQLADFDCIGVSIHSLNEARLAEQNGADYVTASNIYETGCKEGVPGKGLGFLKEICEGVSIPVFALGGITEEKERQIKAVGAAGACRMSDYMSCL